MLAIGIDTAAGGKAPHLYRLIITRRSEEFPARHTCPPDRVPRNSIHCKGGMTGVSEDSLAAGGIPYLHRAISAGRSETLPIGRPCYAKHPVRMTPVGEDVPAGGGIPYLHRLIKAGRSDTCAVRRPCDGSYASGVTTTHPIGGSQGLR